MSFCRAVLRLRHSPLPSDSTIVPLFEGVLVRPQVHAGARQRHLSAIFRIPHNRAAMALPFDEDDCAISMRGPQDLASKLHKLRGSGRVQTQGIDRSGRCIQRRGLDRSRKIRIDDGAPQRQTGTAGNPVGVPDMAGCVHPKGAWPQGIEKLHDGRVHGVLPAVMLPKYQFKLIVSFHGFRCAS
jgi:hypothetical protein